MVLLICCGLPDVAKTILTSVPMQNPKWTPVPKTQIADVNTSQQGIQTFDFPKEIIPTAAQEVLIFVSLQSGNSEPHDARDDIKIFTADESNEYAKYITIHTYRQNAWSTNSDNVWFPVTNNRKISVDMPQGFQPNVIFVLSAIGYR